MAGIRDGAEPVAKRPPDHDLVTGCHMLQGRREFPVHEVDEVGIPTLRRRPLRAGVVSGTKRVVEGERPRQQRVVAAGQAEHRELPRPGRRGEWRAFEPDPQRVIRDRAVKHDAGREILGCIGEAGCMGGVHGRKARAYAKNEPVTFVGLAP